jgi:quinoprotein glucose dehydrogenase
LNLPSRGSLSALLAVASWIVLTGVGFGCFGSGPSPDPSPERSPESASDSLRDWEWRHYLGSPGRSHASPLAQIDRDNVSRLEVAWRYDSGAPESAFSEIQCNPIVVDGVLFATSARAHVFALDAATGRPLWRFDPFEHGSDALARVRGVVHWGGPEGDRIFSAAGRDVWALDAETGRPIESFGAGGRIDLRQGLAHGRESAFVSATTPGVIYRDLLILGTRVSEDYGAAPGDVRAYDVETGALRWSFHTIPYPGEPGAETWPEGAFESHGGANSWSGLSLDVERGLVFVPTGSATPDFWGGERPGNNLYANSLIALDAATGERRWHFQFVHHDLWDRDLPMPPNLVTIERDGRQIDAVAQGTKSGHVFVFDRVTGEPVFPIEERPVHPGIMEGEWVSPTQPFPTAPPPFTRQGFDLEMIDERGKGFREAQIARLAGARMGENFIPPSLEGSIMFPGFDGGGEWGGASWDAETGLLYVNANEVAGLLALMERPKGFNPRTLYLEKCAVCHGPELEGTGVGPRLRDVGDRRTVVEIYTAIVLGGGRMPSFAEIPLPIIARLTAYLTNPDDPSAALAALEAGPGSSAPYVTKGYVYLRDEQGVPINRPPFGTLSAIDLARGEIRWQVPLGEYPHLVEQGRRGTGTENYGGAVVTGGGLLFIAATADEKIRAFDKRTGEVLWEAQLPAAGYATPATYSVDGRQFVVIAAGGGKLGTKSGSEYVAFALPEEIEPAEDVSGVERTAESRMDE